MAYVESHQSLLRHRKTLRAVVLLRCDRYKFLGHLHALWWWGLDNVPADGCLDGISDEEIAAGAEWDGDPAAFACALTQDGHGFVHVGEDGKRYLHDWLDYAGKYQLRRAKDAQRKRDARGVDCPADVPGNSEGCPHLARARAQIRSAPLGSDSACIKEGGVGGTVIEAADDTAWHDLRARMKGSGYTEDEIDEALARNRKRGNGLKPIGYLLAICSDVRAEANGAAQTRSTGYTDQINQRVIAKARAEGRLK